MKQAPDWFFLFGTYEQLVELSKEMPAGFPVHIVDYALVLVHDTFPPAGDIPLYVWRALEPDVQYDTVNRLASACAELGRVIPSLLAVLLLHDPKTVERGIEAAKVKILKATSEGEPSEERE